MNNDSQVKGNLTLFATQNESNSKGKPQTCGHPTYETKAEGGGAPGGGIDIQPCLRIIMRVKIEGPECRLTGGPRNKLYLNKAEGASVADSPEKRNLRYKEKRGHMKAQSK